MSIDTTGMVLLLPDVYVTPALDTTLMFDYTALFRQAHLMPQVTPVLTPITSTDVPIMFDMGPKLPPLELDTYNTPDNDIANDDKLDLLLSEFDVFDF